MKTIVQFLLAVLARFYIARFRPMIIAVTGNVGKTSTKEAIAAVVRHSGLTTRASKGNLNNEFGVPLTILGDWADEYYERGGTPWFWLKVLVLAKWRFFLLRRYPDVLILEFGADRPGDIRALARRYRPHIAVVTAVGDIPVHVEYYEDAEHVAREKSEIVRYLTSNDHAVLNHDDPRVLAMKDATQGQVITFGAHDPSAGRAGGLDIGFSNFTIRYGINGAPEGIAFKLHNNGSFVPVKIAGLLGSSQAYAVAAAAAVGITLGMNFIEISQAIESYQPSRGRLRILSGIKNTTIIDDTYNASPASMRVALETLKEIVALRNTQGKTTRVLVVLGDMLELGKYSIQAHEEVGDEVVAGVVDVLVCVGEKAKLIAEAAEKKMPSGSVFQFHTSEAAKPKVQELVQEGDIILVKGSQGMRMERIVEEIMAEPERKGELLVRQTGGWVKG
ncbi:MAG: UDP-N-acetylmuramoyl-tripeptide--D-alanyl-D-alanine ligase [Patescibacteria group bacterium]